MTNGIPGLSSYYGATTLNFGQWSLPSVTTYTASGNYTDENVEAGEWKCQALSMRLFFDDRRQAGRIDFELIGYCEMPFPPEWEEDARRMGMSRPRLYFLLKTLGGSFDPKTGRVWGDLAAWVGLGGANWDTEVSGASFEGTYSNGTIAGTCRFTHQAKQTYEFRASFRATR